MRRILFKGDCYMFGAFVVDTRVQRSCHKCKAPSCIGEFTEVAALQNSGLSIYVHKDTESSEQKDAVKYKSVAYILHNASERELKRPDYIKKICQYRTKCFQCKKTIQRVQSLLDKTKDINKNEVIGVCEYCKSLNPSGKCKRCEYLVGKFICCKAKQCHDAEERFKTWLCKVFRFLQSSLECENICMDRMKRSSMDDLQKLLQELKSPLTLRQPCICSFPMTDSRQFMTQNKEMLEELSVLMKSADRLSNNADAAHASWTDKTFESKRSFEVLPQETWSLSEEGENMSDEDYKLKATTKSEISWKSTKGKNRDEKMLVDNKEHKTKLKTKLKLPQIRASGKDNEDPKGQSVQISPKVTDGLNLKDIGNVQVVVKPLQDGNKEILDVEESTGSIVECDSSVVLGMSKMIQGKNIVKLDPSYKDVPPPSLVPLLYEVKPTFENKEDDLIFSKTTTLTNLTSTTRRLTKKPKDRKDIIETKGFIYKLSDQKFIDNGWTMLPTTKIMRLMNFYKMLPACPQFNWFEHHKDKIMLYDSGERLAEIGDNGYGKWFYKNGVVALEFYSAEDIHAGQRFIVYSSGEDNELGKTLPRTALACFDYLGNGVVYGKEGVERLKYNQTGGILLDEKIGPPSRWQWHSLNEPPVFIPVFVNTQMDLPDPCLRELMRQHIKNESKISYQDQRAAIELENVVKEKKQKLLKKYKPFQIRMKAVKINDQFSLRIFDQAHIYLLFRDGHISLKLNLGMTLIDTEIIVSRKTDINNVATPYDRFPPKTVNVAEIQEKERNRRLFN